MRKRGRGPRFGDVLVERFPRPAPGKKRPHEIRDNRPRKNGASAGTTEALALTVGHALLLARSMGLQRNRCAAEAPVRPFSLPLESRSPGASRFLQRVEGDGRDADRAIRRTAPSSRRPFAARMNLRAWEVPCCAMFHHKRKNRPRKAVLSRTGTVTSF